MDIFFPLSYNPLLNFWQNLYPDIIIIFTNFSPINNLCYTVGTTAYYIVNWPKPKMKITQFDSQMKILSVNLIISQKYSTIWNTTLIVHTHEPLPGVCIVKTHNPII